MYYNTARLTLAKINDRKNHSDSHRITDHAQLFVRKERMPLKCCHSQGMKYILPQI